jgi:hypothetical protein
MIHEACRTCSDWSRTHGEQAVGTATGYEQFLIVEVPLPWPFAVTEAKGFPAGLVDVIAEGMRRKLNFRFEAIVPDPEWSRPGLVRVIRYQLRRVDGSLGEKVSFHQGFRRLEYLVPPEAVAPVSAALLYDWKRLDEFATWAVDSGPVRDLLVCTQGSRDASCGHYGYPLYREIREGFCDGTNLRVWRASHIGGHRFAGTMLDFPAGVAWGHVTSSELGPLLRQTEGPSAHCYRGSLAPATHWEQIAEREALLLSGWAWLSAARRTSVIQEGPGWAEVLVEGSSRRWRAKVSEQAQVMSQPNTRGPLRSESQYAVTSWEAIK